MANDGILTDYFSFWNIPGSHPCFFNQLKADRVYSPEHVIGLQAPQKNLAANQRVAIAWDKMDGPRLIYFTHASRGNKRPKSEGEFFPADTLDNIVRVGQFIVIHDGNDFVPLDNKKIVQLICDRHFDLLASPDAARGKADADVEDQKRRFRNYFSAFTTLHRSVEAAINRPQSRKDLDRNRNFGGAVKGEVTKYRPGPPPLVSAARLRAGLLRKKPEEEKNDP